MQEYRGTRLTIRSCEQPSPDEDPTSWMPESWWRAIKHMPVNKHAGCWARMIARRNYFADQGPLRSPDHWNTEGILPDGKHFYAIKVDRLRAYGWFSSRNKGVFHISHCTYKKGQKLSQEDANKVINNWRKIEASEV